MRNIILIAFILIPSAYADNSFDEAAFEKQMNKAANYFSFESDTQSNSTKPQEVAKKREIYTPKEKQNEFRDLEQVYFDEVKTKASGFEKSKKPKRKRARQ